MLRFERCGEEYNALGVLGDPLQCGGEIVHRSDPHKKHRIYPKQAFIKGLGKSKVRAHHINARRKINGFRIADKHANLRFAGCQLSDHVAANIARGSNDEDTIPQVPLPP